jgi:DNA modification methylase
MKTIEIKLEDLHPYEQNAKLHPPKQIKQVARSIKEFGFLQPLVVDRNKEIIVGHGRYFAALQLGLKTVPCIQVSDLTDEQVDAYRIADNKLNESDWNMNLVIEQLKFLETKGIDITITGFDRDIFDIKEDSFNAEEEYDKIKKANTKFGDIILLGEHRLYCGDATAYLSFDKLMDGNKARLVFTDPPYGVAYSSGSSRGDKSKHDKIKNDDLKGDALSLFLSETFKNLFAHSTDDACFYIWHATSTSEEFRKALTESDISIHQTIIWLKTHFTLARSDYQHVYEPCFYGWKNKQKHYTNKKLRSWDNVLKLDINDFSELLDVWYVNRDNLATYEHPTQKPVKLAERAIKKSSEVSDIVVDCFAGSGSTLVACHQLGRRCYSMELDPKYCDVIIKRFELLTGLKAKVI